jgi:2-methylisocitrate lyase-like PEP mutase family enzyme
MVLPSHVPIDLLNAEFCAEMRVPLVHMSLENQSLETRAAFDAAGIKLCAYQLPAFLAVVEAFQQALEDTRQGLRSPDGRSSVERNEVILDVVDLEGWSRLLRSTEGAPG